jgi:hypothetical protein
LNGFDRGAFSVVEAVADDAGHPFVWRQAKRWKFKLQLTGEGRLTGTRQAAD